VARPTSTIGVSCAYGPFIRVTSILEDWWRYGARRYWPGQYCVARREVIVTIRNLRVFVRTAFLVPPSMHTWQLYTRKRKNGDTHSMSIRLAHSVQLVRCQSPPHRLNSNGDICCASSPDATLDDVGSCARYGARDVIPYSEGSKARSSRGNGSCDA